MDKVIATIEYMKGFNIDCSTCAFYRDDTMCDKMCTNELRDNGLFRVTQYKREEG